MNKTSRIINILLIVAAMLFAAGCSEEESPFDGHDNHLVSFSITLPDGVKYVASIQENEIVVTVPFGVSLNGASAEYKLCENASIAPDPATIGDWDKEQIFRVAAYNDEYVSYIYRICRTDVVSDGTITLETQADVDAFAAKGTTVVTGNLIIGRPVEPVGGYDAVKNIDALSTITEVGMNIIVNGTYKGDNLNGLANVKTAGGIYIGQSDNPVSLASGFTAGLPMLEKAGTVSIVSDSVKSINLGKLASVSNFIYIKSENIGELDLGKLENCSGNITVSGITTSSTTVNEANINAELESIKMQSLKTVGGNLVIENLWGVKSADLKSLENVSGLLQLKELRRVEKIELPALAYVGGDLDCRNNDNMIRFSAPMLKEAASFYLSSYNSYSISLKEIDLPLFEQCTRDFTIRYAAMESLTLPALKRVGGALSFTSMLFAEKIETPALEQMGSLALSGLNMLESFDAGNVGETSSVTISCNNLKEFVSPAVVRGNFSITNSSTVNLELAKITGLDTVTGQMKISAANFTEVVFPDVKVLGSIGITANKMVSLEIPQTDSITSFALGSFAQLEKFSAPKLKSTGSFSMKGSYMCDEIHLPALEKITGDFTFYGGSSSYYASKSIIANMNGFAALKSAKSVTVRYCGNLTDFTGLKEVAAKMDASGWKVSDNKYNPTHEDMINGKYVQE